VDRLQQSVRLSQRLADRIVAHCALARPSGRMQDEIGDVG
jgi:hypothetical protein